MCHSPLRDAISAAAIPSLSERDVQSVAALADLNLPCQSYVEIRLRDLLLPNILDKLPRRASDVEILRYEEHLRQLRVHCFGGLGTRIVLGAIGVVRTPSGFGARASDHAALVCASDVGVDGATDVVDFTDNACLLDHVAGRPSPSTTSGVIGYVEYHLVRSEPRVGGSGASCFEMDGCGLRSGDLFDATAFEPGLVGAKVCRSGGAPLLDAVEVRRWVRPVQLAFPAATVDRSKCAEYQLLADLVLRARRAGLVSAPDAAEDVLGAIWLFTTATPCASCVGVISQLRGVFPNVRIGVAFPQDSAPPSR